MRAARDFCTALTLSSRVHTASRPQVAASVRWRRPPCGVHRSAVPWVVFKRVLLAKKWLMMLDFVTCSAGAVAALVHSQINHFRQINFECPRVYTLCTRSPLHRAAGADPRAEGGARRAAAARAGAGYLDFAVRTVSG